MRVLEVKIETTVDKYYELIKIYSSEFYHYHYWSKYIRVQIK